MTIHHLLFLLLLLSSCTSDGLVPCDGEGPEGKLCREYRHANGSPVGYVEFEYQGDSVVVSSFFDQNSALQKTVTERFESGRTTVISEQYSDQDSKVQTWHYNGSDSLESIVHGANDSMLQIVYEEGKRKRESYLNAGELNRYLEYRYFQDDGNLYRIYLYNAQDVLLSYRSFEYFNTGHHRVSYFSGDHTLLGRRVYRFSQAGLISSIEFTDSSGTVTEREDYIYDGNLNLIERTETKRGQKYKSVFLYY